MSAPDEVPTNFEFAREEERILEYWKSIDAFRTSVKLSEGRPEYTFYDGPPFATGLPHYGHILAGTIKDTVTRFAHQTGHHVERRFGWDCHGLPVEYEIDQALGIKDRNEVLERGIANYNNECRSIVLRYTKEWEATVTRLGRWIDFENDYKTMNPWFMESVWWVFKTLYDKGLVYRGFKVMPYSTACSTPLSNFEAGLNYKDVDDPAISVAFPLVSDPDVSLVAWTTTPWTLPSNMALCVHPDFEYCKIRDVKTGKLYILMKDRLPQLYPIMDSKKFKPEQASTLYELLETFPGKRLEGLQYKPLFNYFADVTTAFRVICDTYVTSDSGTGVVHNAPAFGEDDLRVCLENGIVAKDAVPCPVDDNGRFTSQVPPYQGVHVKQADPQITEEIAGMGRLVANGRIVHSVPFCWRSDTPLIYKAVPSWFVSVETLKEKLLRNNEQTYWVPAFVKEKRFHNWLADAKDWAISRNRFWGTPIPLWVSDDMEEIVAVGSIEELHQLSGTRPDDLHREFVDPITIPSRQGKGVLRRVEEVFDCWFESGSMPYAQQHYPFENADRFEKGFPADFIAEGLDQTRGWFYTLMVIATGLFDKPAFKNLICNGLVLAADGRKMSKRLKNYPDPVMVVNKYGADALRLYLINSPVVRAEPLKFKEEGVLQVVREVFLPWYNAFRFFSQNVHRWETATGSTFVPDSALAASSTNDLDVWIQASLTNLVQFVHQEMGAYRLYTVVPRLLGFLEELTNWYLRLNRGRLKGANSNEDAHVALAVLYDVLMTMTQLMAPFTPFFTESLYQQLRKYEKNYGNTDPSVPVDAVGKSDSVHYLMLPSYDPNRLNPESERRMKVLQTAVELGRVARERRNLSLKTPVKDVIVLSGDATTLDDLDKLRGYFLTEMNTWSLTLSTEEERWCAFKVVPNGAILGKRLGRKLKEVTTAVKQLSNTELLAFLRSGTIEVCGEVLNREELYVNREFVGDKTRYEAAVSGDGSLVVLVDTLQDESTMAQSYARELVNRVQKLRKKAGLQVGDSVEVYFEEKDGEQLLNAVKQNAELVQSSLQLLPLPAAHRPSYAVVIADEKTTIGPMEVHVYLTMPALAFDHAALLKLANNNEQLAKLVAQYVYTLEYSTAVNLPEVSLVLNGEHFTLRKDVHYFANTAAMLRATDKANFKWLA